MGGGPVGMYSAYWANKLGMQVTLFEEKSQLSGQLFHSYPLKEIYDLPGIDTIQANEFVAKLKNQCKSENITVKNNTCITKVTPTEKGVIVQSDNTTYEFDAVCLATGCGRLMPRTLRQSKVTQLNLDHFVKDIYVYYS